MVLKITNTISAKTYPGTLGVMYKAPEVFIVSSGRSGTTLLVSMLNASEQIFIPYESDFIARVFPEYGERASFSKDDYGVLIDVFFRSSQPTGWGMEKRYLLEYLCKASPQDFASVHSVICRAYHEKMGTQNLIWGIKAPVLIASLNRIRQVHPSSKIVHIVRDGRDVFLSYRRVHEKSAIKFGPKNVWENALYWIDGLRRIDEFSGGQLYELRYEDLLTEPESELRNLCNFLDIDYSPAIHKSFQLFGKNQKLSPKNLASTLHANIARGLDPNNLNKYKSQMKIWERVAFEIICYPYLLKYGYDIDFTVSKTPIFQPLRHLLYLAARIVNDWRYARRDRLICRNR